LRSGHSKLIVDALKQYVGTGSMPPLLQPIAANG
jgi:hypothetical protein